jgi:rRNA maturation RNase YbeY
LPVRFHTEEVAFRLRNKGGLRTWVKLVIAAQQKKTGSINFIFCSDEYLLNLNQRYLHHNTFTDIITFDNSMQPETIEGDIFISIERVKENALRLKIDFNEELHRVMIHGILHLLGFDDKKPSAKKLMRKMEDACLKKRGFTPV